MATFKVGQRVRVVWPNWMSTQSPHGQEGVISAAGSILDWWVVLSLPHTPPPESRYPTFMWQFSSDRLAPLTDPSADAFIERVKSWKPEPVVPAPEKSRDPQTLGEYCAERGIDIDSIDIRF